MTSGDTHSDLQEHPKIVVTFSGDLVETLRGDSQETARCAPWDAKLRGMSKAWSQGSSASWRRIRQQVLDDNEATNQGRCTLQIPGVCTGQANQVHHTRPRLAVGDNPKYLTAVCRACNLHVGDPDRTNPQPKVVTRW